MLNAVETCLLLFCLKRTMFSRVRVRCKREKATCVGTPAGRSFDSLLHAPRRALNFEDRSLFNIHRAVEILLPRREQGTDHN